MELPEYLSNIKVKKAPPPASIDSRELPFSALGPFAFERFCCELLIRKAEIEQGGKIVRIVPIGEQGQKQYGSDVFCVEQSSQGTIYSLYEVKRRKKYRKSDFEETIKRFIDNYHNWNCEISWFYIFVSHNISAEQIVFWQEAAGKLSLLNVNYVILTPSNYSRWLTDKPELVYTYFHEAWVEILYGKKGLWHLQKYGMYKFEEPASWVDYEHEEILISDDELRYINDHVRVHCYMPSLSRRHISCFFELRNGRFSHVMITLGNRDFLSKYFYGVNAPLSTNIRKYLIPHYRDSDKYILDIGNCRMTVSTEEAQCTCQAFDIIWNDYKNRVQKIEEILQTKYFPATAGFGNTVPLMRIKSGLWRIMKEFVDNHDYTEGNSPWNIFLYSQRWIRIFTLNETERMISGNHCTLIPSIYDSQWTNPCGPRNDVQISWQHPFNLYSDVSDKIGPRYLWDAKTAHDWLRDEFIPEALSWHKKMTAKQTIRNRIKERFFSKSFLYDPKDYLTSNFEPPIGEGVDWTRNGALADFISELQNFCVSLNESIYLDAKAHRSVFSALYLVMKHCSSKEFSYINSNVNYLKAGTIDELLERVLEQSTSLQSHCDNALKIEHILRSMLACLEMSYLNNPEVLSVVEHLKPVTSLVNDKKMLMRQQYD